MAHSLVFGRFGDGGDPSSLEEIVRAYVADKSPHVSDMLDLALDPSREGHIENLADYAIASGNKDFLYDIGKFGSYDCLDCGKEDIDPLFDEDCDEE